MGKHRHIILAGVALSLALFTSVVVYKWVQAKSGEESSKEINVVVADRNLQWGTVIQPDMLKVSRYFNNNLPAGLYVDPAKLDGRVITTSLNENEPVLESKLAPVGVTNGGVAAVIPQGMRAMAISVDKEKDISGFIHPGNRVDVLVSINQVDNNNKPETKTVLENIPVLAVGADLDNKQGKEKPAPVDIITLEVTPEQAETLTLASTQGKLQLSLRSFTDNQTVTTKGSTIPSMLGAPPVSSAPKMRVARRRPVVRVIVKQVPVPQKKPDMTTISLTKGSKVDEVKFKGGE